MRISSLQILNRLKKKKRKLYIKKDILKLFNLRGKNSIKYNFKNSSTF